MKIEGWAYKVSGKEKYLLFKETNDWGIFKVFCVEVDIDNATIVHGAWLGSRQYENALKEFNLKESLTERVQITRTITSEIK